MRIVSLILLLALTSCVPPFRSSHRLSRVEAAAIAAAVDTLLTHNTSYRPKVVSKSSLATFVRSQDLPKVEQAIRSVRDSLWLAEPEDVPVCAIAKCGLLLADQLSISRDKLVVYFITSIYKACGHVDYEVEVLMKGNSVVVSKVETGENGDCGIRGKPPQQ